MLSCEKPVSRTTLPSFLTLIYKQSCIKSLFDVIVDIFSWWHKTKLAAKVFVTILIEIIISYIKGSHLVSTGEFLRFLKSVYRASLFSGKISCCPFNTKCLNLITPVDNNNLFVSSRVYKIFKGITTNHMFGRAIWYKLPVCAFENFEIVRVKPGQFQNFQKSRWWLIP